MSELERTRHAKERAGQRGLREEDLDLLYRMATPMGEGEWLVTGADVAREMERHKQEMRKIERLRGWKLIAVGGKAITVYHPDRAQTRRDLRQKRKYE